MRITVARRNWTPTGVADVTNYTDAGYLAIQGGNSTQQIRISDCYVAGLASAAQSPMNMVVAFDSQVATGTLGGTVGSQAKDANITSLSTSPIYFTTSTLNKPQRPANNVLLSPTINALGGLMRWTALEPDDRIKMVGNAANAGEVSLSMDTAGSTAAAIVSTFTIEPM